MAVSEALVAELAGAVLDGTPIDWAAVESNADEADRALIQQLKVMATVADVYRHPPLPHAHAPLTAPTRPTSPNPTKIPALRGLSRYNPTHKSVPAMSAVPSCTVVILLFLAVLQPNPQVSRPIGGVVFEDANGNGRRDAGERGLGGVAVSNQQEIVATAADGTYLLPRAGFGVVFISAPDSHAPVGRFWRAVPVQGTGEASDFGLQPHTTQTTFTFMHVSDPHVSKQSIDRLQKVRAIVEAKRPDFVLVTGDLVRDALRVGEDEARGYYDLYKEEIARFPVPVWSVPGNHENFGIERHLSLVSSSHPLYGKAMYRRQLGPNYYSFTYGGVHFVGLDSVDISDLWYYGHIDQVQLAWLRADLERLSNDAPVVTFNHIPFVSAVDMVSGYRDDDPAPTLIKVDGHTVFRHIVSNFKEVLPILQTRDWVLALGGHFHTRETIQYASAVRTRFHQAAAVIGPTDNTVPAISGVTLYRVKNRVIDDGEFIPLK